MSLPLLLLYGLNILCHILQANVSIVAIFLDLVEYRPPDRHFARAVGLDQFITGDYAAHSLRRKETAISFCNRSQVRYRRVQDRSNRPFSFPIVSVASGAVSVK